MEGANTSRKLRFLSKLQPRSIDQCGFWNNRNKTMHSVSVVKLSK